ncbi:photoreceptor ankyrin repeat protein [Lepisosteus oculatus]|uniref:photoreceptor ankyrin repeat protein n=1 Tax=Lepisosteus oculatus TaxID=7918 RepID=UPI0035F515C6
MTDEQGVAGDPNLDSGGCLEDESTWGASTSSGNGEDEDDDADTASILSDDSVFPDYTPERENKGLEPALTLYQACAQNDAQALARVLERGVTPEEVMELDINGRNGLMLASYKGFVDITAGLDHCPYLDVNHQDNDGNTALMIAAQAGHSTIVNHLLNYYPGVDTEVRDKRGFTALIKAAMQGRDDCVAALLMAGAELDATDQTRGKTAREWAVQTGRFQTLTKIRRLLARPRAEQFCQGFVPEWPALAELAARAAEAAARGRGPQLSQRIRDSLTFRFPRDPEDGGVLDHMVRVTTAISSPFVGTACRPLCPTSPPAMGKRRLAVPEILSQYPGKQAEDTAVRHSNGSVSSSSSSCSSGSDVPAEPPRRGSMLSLASSGVRSFLPGRAARRNSVFPAGCVPQIKVTKSGEPTPKKEKKKKSKGGNFLEPPKWKYKEVKEEKKRAEKEKEESQERKTKEKKKKKK